MAVSFTPWLGCVTLATANQVYQLSALLQALGTDPPYMPTPPRCQFVSIQADPSGNAGGARFYIGNEHLSASNFGVCIFSTQVWPIYSMDANLIRLDHIYVMCDTDNLQMGVNFLTR